MAVLNFEIGSTSTLTNVETLTTVPAMAPQARWLDYQEVAQLASGAAKGLGPSSVIWQWGFIPAAMYNTLRGIIAGASAEVYIRTLSSDYSTYKYYTATAIWQAPADITYRDGRYLNFAITFTNLVEYTVP